MYDMTLIDAEAKANSQRRSRESSARYRKTNKEQIQKKHAEYNAEHRENIKENQARYNAEHRDLKRKRDAEYHIQHRPEKIAKQADAREYLASNQTAMGRIKLFRMAQRDGLVYGCISCHRLFFKSGVDFLGSKYWKDKLHILEPLKVHEDEDFSTKYLCGTCKRYLKTGKLPPMCFKNGLDIETMPNDLKLSELEAVLDKDHCKYEKSGKFYLI